MNGNLYTERKKLLCSVEKLLEGPMIFLGFVWLILLIVEFIGGLSAVLQTVSIAIWVLFIIDFIIKFSLSPAKLHFLKVNWLTVISLIIPGLRIFRFLRVLRLIKGVRLIKVVGSLNRSMRSLSATMSRRGFGYVTMLTVVVNFAGAAGMYAIEKGHQGFENYGMAIWWTSMRIITAGSDYWPTTAEGRTLAFILSLFGYAIFGYVTATLATFFIGRDAEEEDAPVAGAKEVEELKKMMVSLSAKMDEINKKISR